MPSRLLTALAVVVVGGQASASDWSTLLDGRLRLGLEGSFTLASEDRGFFNYTDYERSVLRMARLSVSAELRASEHLALLAEVRNENVRSLLPYALYLRYRPWKARHVDVQAGRIPPVFGAFSRRRYGMDNPLIGYPLAYQYLTSLRADAVPQSADELQTRRGGGWLVGYPLGAPGREPGLPLVNGLRWDTGIELRLGAEPLSLSAALTQGTLANPRFQDDNDGKQLSARLEWQPVTGLWLGVSGARGAFLDRRLMAALPASQQARRFAQRALGLDAEYSRAYWLVRAEAVWSAWDVPAVQAPLLPRALGCRGVMVEGRYKLAPGLWLAARVDRLDFDRILGSQGAFTWDAPVTRLEAGAGYSLLRHVTVKAAWQSNRRDGGFVRRQDFAVLQLLLWQ